MMSSHIPFRISALILLGGLVCAAAVIFLLNFLFAGPKLGSHYDLLLNLKPQAASREILIIETADYIESDDIYSALVTLTEMESSNLVLAGRVSPSSSPIILTEIEVRRRFTDEYDLLGSNIRNLFEGIRTGAVHPAQAPVFVEQVVELAHSGRDRLISALIDRDEDLLRAAAVFGNYLQAETRPDVDSDGKLRRVKPADPDNETEHPVFAGLKSRYAVSQIESSGDRRILWLRSHNAADYDISLDTGGNIITGAGSDFRRIDISVFRGFKEAENAMYEAMTRANEYKAFSLTSPDLIPLFVYDYSQQVFSRLLSSPNRENRLLWIASRAEYFNALDEFFKSGAELTLVKSIEDEIADIDPFYEELISALDTEKNNLIRAFVLMYETYDELSSLYSELKRELELSFCIMGPGLSAEYSASLANVLITGNHVTPADNSEILFWTLIAVSAVLLIIFSLRPVVLLPAGVFLSFLPAAVFACLLVYFRYWIDPLIALFSSLTGTAVIFACKCAYLNFRARTFRYAYRTSVSKDVLRGMIKTGSPRLSQVTSSFAAIIAIKDVNLLGREDREESHDAGRAKRAFYSAAKRFIFNSGAVITGFEGETILVCFGSPIDKAYRPVTKACNFVRELLKNGKITWHFGIDAGDCSFFWFPETGFTITGRPAVRARILVSKNARFKTRALVTNSVLEKIHRDGKKIGTFNDESGSVFELPE